MERQKLRRQTREMTGLCEKIRTLLFQRDYDKCRELISEAMSSYPDAPEPHNLYGILMEREGKHAEAMRHFRASWALDPTYEPARYNIDSYGTFLYHGKSAIDSTDCESMERKDV